MGRGTGTKGKKKAPAAVAPDLAGLTEDEIAARVASPDWDGEVNPEPPAKVKRGKLRLVQPDVDAAEALKHAKAAERSVARVRRAFDELEKAVALGKAKRKEASDEAAKARADLRESIEKAPENIEAVGFDDKGAQALTELEKITVAWQQNDEKIARQKDEASVAKEHAAACRDRLKVAIESSRQLDMFEQDVPAKAIDASPFDASSFSTEALEGKGDADGNGTATPDADDFESELAEPATEVTG